MERPLRLETRSQGARVERRVLAFDGVEVSETVVWGPSAAGGTVGLFPDRGVRAALALCRHKPPWTRPAPIQRLSALPGETLWAVVQPQGGEGAPAPGFVVLSAVADVAAGTCSALGGSAMGLDNFEVVVSIGGQEGDTAMLLHVVEAPPAVALTWAAGCAAQLLRQALAARGQRIELRAAKPLPPLLSQWGWCSWDAHGVGVRPEQLVLVAEQHQPPWLVLDDGWQEQVSSEAWRAWLHTPQSQFLAGGHFGDLRALAARLQPSSLLVWHTLHGYWGGVRPGRGYATRTSRPSWPEGLRSGCPGEVDVWEGDFSVLDGDQEIDRYYADFYAALADAGVAGVKCDGQFLAELLAGGGGAAAHAAAQARAAEGAFGGAPPVLHCMGMTLPRLHGRGRAAVTRVSDDHAYPGVEEDAATVARHIWHCAANSLWLRDFFVCDWDMFRTSEWHAAIHAAARAVSGGPVYVSDPADRLSRDALRPLLLPSALDGGDNAGRVVPSSSCGVPIGRQAFVNPTEVGEAWWVANATAAGWIAVAFGLCDVGGELLRGTLHPADLDAGGVGGSCEQLACLQVDLHGNGHAAPLTDAGWDVALHYMHFQVLAVAPLLQPPGGGRRLAVFGLRGVWNPTGTLESRPVIVAAGGGDSWQVDIRARCSGDLLVWADGACSLSVRGAQRVTLTCAGLASIPVSGQDVTLCVDAGA